MVTVALILPWPHPGGVWKSVLTYHDAFAGFGSPAVIMATGGTPSKMIVAPAKPGHLYLLNGDNLGAERLYRLDRIVDDCGWTRGESHGDVSLHKQVYGPEFLL